MGSPLKEQLKLRRRATHLNGQVTDQRRMPHSFIGIYVLFYLLFEPLQKRHPLRRRGFWPEFSDLLAGAAVSGCSLLCRTQLKALATFPA